MHRVTVTSFLHVISMPAVFRPWYGQARNMFVIVTSVS